MTGYEYEHHSAVLGFEKTCCKIKFIHPPIHSLVRELVNSLVILDMKNIYRLSI